MDEIEEIPEIDEIIELLVKIWIPPVDGSTEKILNRVTLEDLNRNLNTGVVIHPPFPR